MILLEYDRSKTLEIFGKKIMARAEEDPQAGLSMDEIIKYMEDADPSPNKRFVRWIASKYANGGIQYLEDMGRVRNALQLFIDNQNFLPERDIGKYASLPELESAVEEFMDREPEAKLSDKKKLFADGEAELVYDSATMQVAIPKTHHASCVLGRNTEWCTTMRDDPKSFDSYNSTGPLYIILLKKENKRWQLHVNVTSKKTQFMDEHDRSADLAEFVKRHPEIKAAMSDRAKSLGLVPFMDDADDADVTLWNLKNGPISHKFTTIPTSTWAEILMRDPIFLVSKFPKRVFGLIKSNDDLASAFLATVRKMPNVVFANRTTLVMRDDSAPEPVFTFYNIKFDRSKYYVSTREKSFIPLGYRPEPMNAMAREDPDLESVIGSIVQEYQLKDPLAGYRKKKSLSSSDEMDQIRLVSKDASALKLIKNPSEPVLKAAIDRSPSAVKLIPDPSPSIQLYIVQKYPFSVKDILVPLAPGILDYLADHRPLALYHARGKIPPKYAPIFYNAVFRSALEKQEKYGVFGQQKGTYGWLLEIVNSYQAILDRNGCGKAGVSKEQRDLDFFAENMKKISGYTKEQIMNCFNVHVK